MSLVNSIVHAFTAFLLILSSPFVTHPPVSSAVSSNASTTSTASIIATTTENNSDQQAPTQTSSVSSETSSQDISVQNPVVANVSTPEPSQAIANAAVVSIAQENCANASAQFEAQSGNFLGGMDTYQNFYNPKTGSCYLQSFNTGYLPYGTEPLALISFRDVYANEALAACWDKNPVSYADDEWTCTSGSDSITRAQFNALVDQYTGQ